MTMTQNNVVVTARHMGVGVLNHPYLGHLPSGSERIVNERGSDRDARTFVIADTPDSDMADTHYMLVVPASDDRATGMWNLVDYPPRTAHLTLDADQNWRGWLIPKGYFEVLQEPVVHTLGQAEPIEPAETRLAVVMRSNSIPLDERLAKVPATWDRNARPFTPVKVISVTDSVHAARVGTVMYLKGLDRPDSYLTFLVGEADEDFNNFWVNDVDFVEVPVETDKAVRRDLSIQEAYPVGSRWTHPSTGRLPVTITGYETTANSVKVKHPATEVAIRDGRTDDYTGEWTRNALDAYGEVYVEPETDPKPKVFAVGDRFTDADKPLAPIGLGVTPTGSEGGHYVPWIKVSEDRWTCGDGEPANPEFGSEWRVSRVPAMFSIDDWVKAKDIPSVGEDFRGCTGKVVSLHNVESGRPYAMVDWIDSPDNIGTTGKQSGGSWPFDSIEKTDAPEQVSDEHGMVVKTVEQMQAEMDRLKAEYDALTVQKEAADTARRQAEVRANSIATDYETDLRKISERLIEESERRDWCSEYDDIVDSLNHDLSKELALREVDYNVTLDVTFRITKSVRHRKHDSDGAGSNFDEDSITYHDVHGEQVHDVTVIDVEEE